MNYTLQDFLGSAIAFILFPVVIVIPGYVVGWVFDLFGFKGRKTIVRFGIGLVLSFAVSPILLHLTSSLLSFNFALLALGGGVIVFLIICVKEKFTTSLEANLYISSFILIGVSWVVFAILSLINIQWGDHLYLSVTSFDQTTRVSIIEAMTRTGIPPINPSYYPGHPVQLTFLYYFWYILGSMVDALGGQFVDARAALNASSVWSGLGLMAAIAFYLQQRNADHGESAWRSARIGVSLLAVSGLDIIPILFLMIRTGQIVGSVDVWNTWIPSWMASVLWAPHHVASLIAGISAMMLVQYARKKKASRQFFIFAIAGFGFASALGLSIYITLVFFIFWGGWLVVCFFQKIDNSLILPMILSGILAIILTSPFLMDLFQNSGGNGGGQFPIVFEIRTFLQLESFVKDWSSIARSLIMFAVLPINYIFELGFFFMVGLYWFGLKDKATLCSHSFYLAEILLFVVALLIGSVLRSTFIPSNDLGWRAWLPGQFILLIWGVDVLENLVFGSGSVALITREEKKNKKLLFAFLSIGVLTSTMDAVLLRTAWPIMTGTEATRRYYSARLAYEYLQENIPADAITQNNPFSYADRPSGLYGSHQMVIADRTSYGVPLDDFNKLSDEVGELFVNQSLIDWKALDRICEEYSIDILIMDDTDPIWDNISMLKVQRLPFYENEHYALFVCGNYRVLHPTP